MVSFMIGLKMHLSSKFTLLYWFSDLKDFLSLI